jgi:hypothetical protein
MIEDTAGAWTANIGEKGKTCVILNLFLKQSEIGCK